MGTKSLLNGIALGAGLMYVLDPQAGSRRRQTIKEKAKTTVDKTAHVAQTAQQKIRETSGKQQALRKQGAEKLSRAGSRAGRFLSRRTGRILTGTAGGALAYYALRRRGTLGAGLGAAGLGLVAMGVRGRAGRGKVRIGTTAHIDASVDKVWDFFSDYANFPKFMSQIKEVRDLGNGRSRWIATGPEGMPVEWDAIVTERVHNHRMGWRSLPDSPVETAGTVHLEQSGRGTDVRLEMIYSPPGGKAGHAVARFLGSDPKRMIREILNEARFRLETSRTEQKIGA
jgi:uncharacterized membrane protein